MSRETAVLLSQPGNLENIDPSPGEKICIFFQSSVSVSGAQLGLEIPKGGRKLESGNPTIQLLGSVLTIPINPGK